MADLRNLRKLSTNELQKLTKNEIIQAIQKGDDSEILKELRDIKCLLADQKKTINEQKKIIHEQQQRIQSLENKTNVIEQNTISEKRIRSLEIKTNIIEQRSKKTNVIISDVDLRSYAEVITGRGNNQDTERSIERDLTAEMVKFFGTKLNHTINTANVVAVYQLRNQRILIKFSSVKEKIDLMAARRSLNMRSWYVNDQMTQIGGELCRRCRELRRNNQLKYVWTRLGKIFVKKTDDSRTIEIQSDEDVEKITLNG